MLIYITYVSSLFTASFSNFPPSAYAYSTISVTWTSPSKSVSGDWIGLFVQGAVSASWKTNVAAGANSGTYSLLVPNTPGPMVFYYVRISDINYDGASSVLTCLPSPFPPPTSVPTIPAKSPSSLPTAPTALPISLSKTPTVSPTLFSGVVSLVISAIILHIIILLWCSHILECAKYGRSGCKFYSNMAIRF